MIVLSLFDGCSCARVALERAGIKIDKYYASEIDKYSIQIAQKNYPDTIQLGSIENWKEWNIKTPDLIVGGSPCQGFSFAGKQLNFDDPRSKLFFTFVDILKHYKPKYFLLENVQMKDKHNDVISSTLGEIYPEHVAQGELFRSGRIEPIEINSKLLSAQNRKRLYWCNWGVEQPEDKGILLKDIIEGGTVGRDKSQTIPATIYKENVKSMLKRKKYGLIIRDKSKCVRSSGRGSYDRHEWDSIDDSHTRKLTPIECERLQTLPDNYTEGVSNTQRYKMLGNGFTVDVIAHILEKI